MNIQRYRPITVQNDATWTADMYPVDKGGWCKYSDAEPLEKKLHASELENETLKLEALSMEETNRLLCRDLDEAQKTIEELRGEKV